MVLAPGQVEGVDVAEERFQVLDAHCSGVFQRNDRNGNGSGTDKVGSIANGWQYLLFLATLCHLCIVSVAGWAAVQQSFEYSRLYLEAAVEADAIQLVGEVSWTLAVVQTTRSQLQPNFVLNCSHAQSKDEITVTSCLLGTPRN